MREITRVKPWARPAAKHGCGRDPMAGPGTCHFWWDGCPRAAWRSCFNEWFNGLSFEDRVAYRLKLGDAMPPAERAAWRERVKTEAAAARQKAAR